MRALLLETYGPPESARVVDVALPAPAPGEVRVRITAAAVNFPDVLIMANKYQVSAPLPLIPGSEFSGVIEALGSGVTRWEIGDRVFGASFVGAFAEAICVRETSIQALPAGGDLEAAAGFWVAHSTAYHSLRSVANVSPGETVLVLGAAGGVGLAAVEIAALLGATVIAAASSEAKLAVCAAKGATHGIDYSHSDLRQGLKLVAPHGIDVVIDPVGGAHAELALRSMRWGGRFVTVGFASGEIPKIALNLVLLKGITIQGFEMRTFSLNAPELAARDDRELLDHFGAGRVRPYTPHRFALERSADALAFVAARNATGKVLITADGD